MHVCDQNADVMEMLLSRSPDIFKFQPNSVILVLNGFHSGALSLICEA